MIRLSKEHGWATWLKWKEQLPCVNQNVHVASPSAKLEGVENSLSLRRLPMIPRTFTAVKHTWFIYHPCWLRWGKKAHLHRQGTFGIRSVVHWEGKKNLTTQTYLKLLASPVFWCYCCQKRIFSGFNNIWSKYSLAMPVLPRKTAGLKKI